MVLLLPHGLSHQGLYSSRTFLAVEEATLPLLVTIASQSACRRRNSTSTSTSHQSEEVFLIKETLCMVLPFSLRFVAWPH